MKLKTVRAIYEAGWKLAQPLTRLSERLEDGFGERTLETDLPPADVWMQAASAGEAYLALEIIRHLDPEFCDTVLVTTNTRQGRDILADAEPPESIALEHAFFPLDRPSLMDKALSMVAPRLVVLLETELWPGLMAACRKRGVEVMVVNGRMTPKSLARYTIVSEVMKKLSPAEVLAISPLDARRYELVFPEADVSVMDNIKFDRVGPAHVPATMHNPVSDLLSERTPFVVFGSVREPEEREVLDAVRLVLDERPMTVIGLFPRHMERIDAWKAHLSRANVPFTLRSELDSEAEPGSVILWNAFGELGYAYHPARAAFLGGSLAPLGGQNFLEAISAGVVAVTGPYWSNFAWAGRELVEKGLLREARSGEEAGEILVRILKNTPDRERVRERFAEYVARRSGGASLAAKRIMARITGAG